MWERPGSDPSFAVSWCDHEKAFYLERGNIVGVEANRDDLSKMLALATVLTARVMGEDGIVYVEVPSSSSSCEARRVIPKAGASLFLSVVGLVLIGIAAGLHFYLREDPFTAALAGSPLPILTFPLVGVGVVAIVASAIYAISSLYPWDKRCSKFAVIALVLDVLPLLFLG